MTWQQGEVVMINRITGFADEGPPTPLGHLNSGVPTARIHFLIHPQMPQLQQYARENGWFEQGFTVLAIPWLELHFTTNGWATSRVLKSSDVPCPVINGWYYLPQVRPGEVVEFAIQAGVVCRKPEDHSASRDQGSIWFNNQGLNYLQTAR